MPNDGYVFDWGLYIWEMWLIMNLKGCRNLKISNNGYVFPQIIDLFGRNYKIYHCCMVVHACYMSLQIYCIIMQ